MFVQNLHPHGQSPDYRLAVGGMWDIIGPLQFDFLKCQGLRPHHRLLDIGCGSMRAGRFFIAYLEPGHYFGLDTDELLVREGIKREIASEMLTEKRPQFAFNGRFEFPFQERPDIAIAHALFSQLTLAQIELCLRNLRDFAPDCRLFATFNETPLAFPNIFAPHPRRTFFYTRTQLERIAQRTGWHLQYMGDWEHPRGQKMLRLET